MSSAAGNKKEMRQLVRELRKEGYEVTVTSGQHYCVRKDGTGPAVFMPQTPSDFRGLHRVHSKLKRIGFHRGKKK